MGLYQGHGMTKYENRGQPTKYPTTKEKLCELFNALIEHMEKGYSFDCFGASKECIKAIGSRICRDTLYQWAETHPDFSYAKKLSSDASRLHWEGLAVDFIVEERKELVDQSTGRVKVFSAKKLNTGIWVINMKNRFKWTDRLETTHEVGKNLKKFSMSYQLDQKPKND